MEDKLQVGVITKPHGVKGAVKVYPTTDDIKRFKTGQKFSLETKKGMVDVETVTVQFFKQYAIIKFDKFDSPEEAALYQGCGLLVDRENAVKLKKDEYFISDLEGLKVCCDEPKKYKSLSSGIGGRTDSFEEDLGGHAVKDACIGVVTDVLTTGANEVIVVKSCGFVFDNAVIEEGRELLFPSIKECIKKIDFDDEMILLHIMPGLLD